METRINEPTSPSLNQDQWPICPYLGLRSDQKVAGGYAIAYHACFNQKRRPTPRLEYQTKYCLNKQYTRCLYYSEPATILEIATVPSYQVRGRTVIQLMGIVFLLIVVISIAGMSNLLDFILPSALQANLDALRANPMPITSTVETLSNLLPKVTPAPPRTSVIVEPAASVDMGNRMPVAQSSETPTARPESNVAYVTPHSSEITSSRQNGMPVVAQLAMATATTHAAQGLPTVVPYMSILANATATTASMAETTSATLTTGYVTSVLRYPPLPWTLEFVTPVPSMVPTALVELTATPVPTMAVTIQDLAAYRGQILFLSDRNGRVETWALDPNTGELLDLVEDSRLHLLASDLYLANSPDNRERALVEAGDNDDLQIKIYSSPAQTMRQITNFAGVTSYGLAWSPNGDRIAFVSTGTGDDDIYTIDTQGDDLVQLTANSGEWDRHPSWSPDGSKLVFYSNRGSGRKQIWMMNADGSDQQNLSNDEFENWDPVWVR